MDDTVDDTVDDTIDDTVDEEAGETREAPRQTATDAGEAGTGGAARLMARYRGIRGPLALEDPVVRCDLAIFRPDGRPSSVSEGWVRQLDPELAELLAAAGDELARTGSSAYVSHADEDMLEVIEDFEERDGELDYEHALRITTAANVPPPEPGPDDPEPVRALKTAFRADWTAPELTIAPGFTNVPALKALLEHVRDHYICYEELEPQG